MVQIPGSCLVADCVYLPLWAIKEIASTVLLELEYGPIPYGAYEERLIIAQSLGMGLASHMIIPYYLVFPENVC